MISLTSHNFGLVIFNYTYNWTDNCGESRDATVPWPTGNVSAAWTPSPIAKAGED